MNERTTMFRQSLCAIAVSSAVLATGAVHAEDSIGAALTGGKVSLDMRYRYEQVDQSGNANTAEASTLRTRLGYTTGSFYNLGAMLEFENITVLGADRYNDGTVNAKTQYPKILDPAGTEVNQAYFSYSGLSDTNMILGRQRITLDNQRWIGNVGWRQNEQTFDAFSLVNKSLPQTQITYGYINNVNRVTGDDAADGNQRMKSHLVNVNYAGMGFGSLTGYGYLLDYDGTLKTKSTQTLGVRFTGSHPLNEDVGLLYSAEYARQSDYGDNPASFDVNYVLGEIGASYSGVTAKYGYEKLGSDGTNSLQTPLATLHAFNGWADVFLTTPAKGLVDQYLSVGTKVMEVQLNAVYHDFTPDKGSGKFGTEWDLLASRGFGKMYTLGIKYADFSADSSPPSAVVDTKKYWVYGELKF